MSDFARTIILGGGLAGLSLARFLEDDCLVLEASERPGGLCRSFRKDGFTYDIGGHILFSRDRELLQTLLSFLGDNLHRKRRNNQIWLDDRFVKYPFENGLSALKKEDIYDCLVGYLTRQDGDPANLEDWCRMRFGVGIAEKYLLPYNDKIWKRSAREMSVHWVERVPSPPLEDVVKSAIGIETEGYTHQLHFYYPSIGGIESLIRGILPRASLETGFRVKKITKTSAGWEVSDGKRVYGCEHLVSTIPVMDLANALENAPTGLQETAAKLVYNSMLVVMLGVNHGGLMDKSAIYLPDPERLPHRVCFMGYFSENNAPPGRSNLVAEITLHPDAPLLMAEEGSLCQRVLEDISDLCDINGGEVVATDVKAIKHAYVVYDLDYLQNRSAVIGAVQDLGIHPLGRFGNFEYINMDATVERALELAAKLNRNS